MGTGVIRRGESGERSDGLPLPDFEEGVCVMKVVIYARYSSENQRESSIEDQCRNCEAFAARQGWTISHKYSDRAISGSTHERPDYQKLLRDAESKSFDVLLVEISRASQGMPWRSNSNDGASCIGAFVSSEFRTGSTQIPRAIK